MAIFRAYAKVLEPDDPSLRIYEAGLSPYLDMHRIKQITAQQITARHCGSDTVTYDTTHALMISTNHDPIVTATDHGSWRRLLALRFPFRYHKPGTMPAAPGPLDRLAEAGLRERLKAGYGDRAEAVLAWLAEGARRWYAGEPTAREPMAFGPEPGRIERDARDWKAKSNPTFAWVLDNLAADPKYHVSSSEVTSAHAAWLAMAGHGRASVQTIEARFAAACAELGWKITKVKAKAKEKHRRTTVSRLPGSVASLTAQYMAWEGLRYKAPGDANGQPGSEEVPEVRGGLPDSGNGTYTRKPPDHPELPEPARSEGNPAVTFTAPIQPPYVAPPYLDPPPANLSETRPGNRNEVQVIPMEA